MEYKPIAKKKPENSLRLHWPLLNVISYSYHTYDLLLFVSPNTVNTLTATTSRKRPLAEFLNDCDHLLNHKLAIFLYDQEIVLSEFAP